MPVQYIRKINDRIQQIIAPGLNNALYKYEDTLKAYVNSNVTWLELGCGHQIFPLWYPNFEERENFLITNCKDIVGIDYNFYSLQHQKKSEIRSEGM